jgi:hypothetical protein
LSCLISFLQLSHFGTLHATNRLILCGSARADD